MRVVTALLCVLLPVAASALLVAAPTTRWAGPIAQDSAGDVSGMNPAPAATASARPLRNDATAGREAVEQGRADALTSTTLDNPSPLSLPILLTPLSRHVVNASLYGVRCDGVTDDTAAARVAISAAQSLASTMLAATAFNQYFRGGVEVKFRAGPCRFSDELVVTSGHVGLVGDGSMRTTFIRSSDYGDTVRVVDPRQGNNTGGAVVRGIGFLSTAPMTRGAHLHLVNTSFGDHGDLWFQNGYRGLVLEGVAETDFTNVRAKVTSSVYGAARPGSSFVYLKPNASHANSNVRFRGLTASSDDALRYVENGIVIEDADVVHFSDVELAGVSDTEVLLRAGGTNSIQGVRFRAANFDNFANYGVRITGTTSGAVQKIDIEGGFFEHSVNHVLIDSPQAAAVRVAIEGTGVGREAIVVAPGVAGPVTIDHPVLRGVANAATSPRQYSAVSIGSNYVTVRDANLAHGPFDLRYGVELLDGAKGVIVTGVTGLVGKTAYGLVRANDSMPFNAIAGVPQYGADAAPGIGSR